MWMPLLAVNRAPRPRRDLISRRKRASLVPIAVCCSRFCEECDMTEEKIKKISFRQKTPTVCPVCRNEFFREEMLTGGGRLIAGRLTDELRRTYEKNVKFGVVIPAAYIMNVCPKCLYTALPKDFDTLSENELGKIRAASAARVNIVKRFFGNISFNADRNLELAAASYLLAVDVYSMRRKEVAPTFKRAVSSIRAAWLFHDMAEKYKGKNYEKLSDFFYSKSYDFYVKCLELMQNGQEPSDAAGNMGPDTDKNWGYDGMLYMYAMLTVKVCSKEKDIRKKIEKFDKTKIYLSRIFGMGKSNKDKPSQILDMTRDLYDKINTMLEEWKKELPPESAE